MSRIVFLALCIELAGLVSAQQPGVIFCPLYLALQNRCPSSSTTPAPTSTGDTTSVQADEDDTSCGTPLITFCPAAQVFLAGDRTCTTGQTIQITLTNMARLLIDPSRDRAGSTVGSSYVNELGNSLNAVAKTIQATPTQAPIGVTFIPIGQIIGGG